MSDSLFPGVRQGVHGTFASRHSLAPCSLLTEVRKMGCSPELKARQYGVTTVLVPGGTHSAAGSAALWFLYPVGPLFDLRSMFGCNPL